MGDWRKQGFPMYFLGIFRYTGRKCGSQIHGRLQKSGIPHVFFRDFPVCRQEMWKPDTWEKFDFRLCPCIVKSVFLRVHYIGFVAIAVNDVKTLESRKKSY